MTVSRAPARTTASTYAGCAPDSCAAMNRVPTRAAAAPASSTPRTPCAAISTHSGSINGTRKLTPNGPPVSQPIWSITWRRAGGGTMTPANIPWPPAFATAATSSGVPTVPIGASCSGSSQPTSSVKRVAGTAALTELRAADRVVHGEGPLGAPLVVELEAGAGLHLPLACAGEDLLPVLRGVVAP